ncbi:MAG: hypothetical protein LBR07_05580 [Puniceicoccales bacterium]|nr:hypothetical protein [Puniceicoccales bacterium]
MFRTSSHNRRRFSAQGHRAQRCDPTPLNYYAPFLAEEPDMQLADIEDVRSFYERCLERDLNQWSVASGQWPVVSGQWPVVSESTLFHPSSFNLHPSSHPSSHPFPFHSSFILHPSTFLSSFLPCPPCFSPPPVSTPVFAANTSKSNCPKPTPATLTPPLPPRIRASATCRSPKSSACSSATLPR